MKRKRWVIAAVICVLLGGYTAGIYGQTDKLTKKQITDMDNKKNQEEIAKNVLKDTDNENAYDLNDLEKVTVYYGNVNGTNDEDAVIAVYFSPKDTVIAAYTSDGEVYEYIGDIGNFYGVDNVQFVPLKTVGRDVIVVEEVATQLVGAFEKSTLLRGYLYDKGTKFDSVLKTPIEIEAEWNAIWDNPEIQELSNWKKTTENAETKWETVGESPKLDVVRFQKYFTAQNVGKQLPADSKFIQQSSRVVMEEFYWSDIWERFIIGEAIEKKTGEPVAVLENRDNGPYVLAGVIENSYLIQRKNGSQEIVNVDELEWREKPKEVVQQIKTNQSPMKP